MYQQKHTNAQNYVPNLLKLEDKTDLQVRRLIKNAFNQK